MTDFLSHTLEDFGTKYQIKGAIYGDGNTDILIMLPFSHLSPSKPLYLTPTYENWRAFLKQVDNPTLIIKEEGSQIVKDIIQKNSRQVQEDFRWGIFRRDGYRCQYCGHTDLPLTIDEYLCQALGGPINEENCKTACRPCNKAKGHMTPEEWENYRQQRGLVYVGG